MGRPPDALADRVGHHGRTTRPCLSPRATPDESKEDMMAGQPRASASPIRVGVIADQTGPLEPAGTANANVARMVVGDINAKGGLLGRPLELCLEDGATIDEVAAAKAAKLVQQDEVDVLLGGIFSSTRQAIKGP